MKKKKQFILCFKDHDWNLVPSEHGGEYCTIPSPSMLFNEDGTAKEWEAVTPDEILV